MNETRTFLFQAMAEAETLPEFWMAYRAVRRLEMLMATAQVQRQRDTMPGMQASARPQPVRDQQQAAESPIPPHFPPPLNPELQGEFRREELAPDYDKFPWENR